MRKTRGGKEEEVEEAVQGSETCRLIACDKLLDDMMGTGDYVRRWR